MKTRNALLTLSMGLVLAHSAFMAQAAVITAGCANTHSCSFPELFDGGSLTVDDKEFVDWFLIGASANYPPDPSVMWHVIGLDDQPPNPGLFYNFDAGSIGAQFKFAYTVRTLDGRPLIKDSSLQILMGSVSPPFSINEVIEDAAGNLIGTMETWWLSYSNYRFVDDIVFSPQSELRVTVEILSERDSVINLIEQRFSQVSEPATLALLGLGLAGLGFSRRKPAQA